MATLQSSTYTQDGHTFPEAGQGRVRLKAAITTTGEPLQREGHQAILLGASPGVQYSGMVPPALLSSARLWKVQTCPRKAGPYPGAAAGARARRQERVVPGKTG